MLSKSNKSVVLLAFLALVGSGLLLARRDDGVSNSGSQILTKINNEAPSAIVYRSRTCGCCGSYISYLRRAGIDVEEKITTDSAMDGIKEQFGVPSELQTCHTMRIENYTVEGHVPVEAVEKLLSERPAIAGIGLAGMPPGSPGMPGDKIGLFEISSFDSGGNVAQFVSL